MVSGLRRSVERSREFEKGRYEVGGEWWLVRSDSMVGGNLRP